MATPRFQKMTAVNSAPGERIWFPAGARHQPGGEAQARVPAQP